VVTSGAAVTEGAAGRLRDWAMTRPRLAWGLFWVAFFLVPTTVTAFSELTEAERAGRDLAAWKPFVWEYTSATGSLLTIPVLMALHRRTMAAGTTLPAFLGLHALGCLFYFAVHVGTMVALRHAIYALAGDGYDFGDPARELLYEFRKDLPTYAAIVLVLSVARLLAGLGHRAATADAEAPAGVQPLDGGPVELRIGSRRLYLAPDEILWLKAAGNYVEVSAQGAVHLVRRPLADLLAELPAGRFVRVHRSFAVNRGAIARIDSKPSGDMVLCLRDGTEVPASRRFREALLSPAGA